jgi:pantothenate kinase-related protein Tda10
VTHDDGAHQVLALPHEWLTLRKQLLTANMQPVLFICGKKGSGKSTLARFLVNSLLFKWVLPLACNCTNSSLDTHVSCTWTWTPARLSSRHRG